MMDQDLQTTLQDAIRTIADYPTATAATQLLQQLGAEIVAACFVIDLPDLGGADRLRALGVPVRSLLSFSGH